MVTVACFLYSGKRKNLYKPKHVQTLKRMVSENLTIPHEFVCITDREIEGVKTYPIWQRPEVKSVGPDNWIQLGIFGIAPELGEKILVLDLGILIRRNIDHLITDKPFSIVKGKAAPYASGVYCFDADKYKHVWESFDPVESPKIVKQNKWVGSDQCWISHTVPNAHTWTHEDGIYKFTKVRGKPLSDDVCMVIHGGIPKPFGMKHHPHGKWVYEEYVRYTD